MQHTPEYIAETNMPWIIAVLTIVHILAMILVVLRIYTRVVLLRAPGWDDWTMLASAVCQERDGLTSPILTLGYETTALRFWWRLGHLSLPDSLRNWETPRCDPVE